jgi:plastocyanin
MRTIRTPMKLRTLLIGTTALVAVVSCSSSGGRKRPANPFYDHVDSSKPEPKPGPGKAADPKPTGKLGPVGEKAQTLREAADQLDKAQESLDRGNRNLAEQLFSTAELLIGAEALASVAPRFREGAPPRVTTPTQRIDTAAPPQPKTAGSSEAEDEADQVPPPPKVDVASLTGMVKVEGGAAGTLGLITLEPVGGKWKPRTPKRVVVEQRNREFLPNLVAVSVGSTIAFPNFDGVFHNVFSTAPAAPFDLGLYKAGEAREFTFTKEGIIRLGCNLHANMSAYIAVVAAPAYVVTDANGAFAFRRLTPGKYKVRAWSVRSKAPIEREITLKAGKNQIDLGVAADAPAGPPPDKFGGKRG